MPTSASGVVYTHISHSETDRTPKEKADPNGSFTAKVSVECDWGKRFTLLADIAANGGEIYPYEPSTNAVAVAAGIKGVGATQASPASGLFAHDKAVLTVVYYYHPGGGFLNNGLLMIEQMHSVSSAFAMPVDNMTWGGVGAGVAGGAALTNRESPKVDQTLFEYIRTYPRLMIENSFTYRLADYVNDRVIACVTLNHEFSTESLRYIGPQVEMKLQLGTLWTRTVSHHFLYQPPGWNRWYNPATNQWERIWHSGLGGTWRPYPLANLEIMFNHW